MKGELFHDEGGRPGDCAGEYDVWECGDVGD